LPLLQRKCAYSDVVREAQEKSEGQASLSEICPQPAGQVGAGSEFEQRLAKRFNPEKVELSDGSLLGSGQSSKAASEQPQDQLDLALLPSFMATPVDALLETFLATPLDALLETFLATPLDALLETFLAAPKDAKLYEWIG
jgi:hypothetical protein